MAKADGDEDDAPDKPKAKGNPLHDNPRSQQLAGRYLDPAKDDDAQSMLDVEDAKRNPEPIPPKLDKRMRKWIRSLEKKV